ncbi:MAG TPA: alpha/beta hydrolase [Xanthobacteraceae bacterium]|nr:alpha/beta hydrolase [Xanthobacteraceae bacterium]
MNWTVSGRRSRGNRSTILQLYHERHGAGRPVIALHGYGETLYTWHHLAAPLGAQNELYLFDLKGHGRSPKPRDGKYAAEDQAELLHDFVLERNLTGVTLMGHSMGGGIALLLAERLLAERPDRLASLVLLGSVSYPQPIAALARIIAVPFLGETLLTIMPPGLVVRAVLRGAYYDAEKITADDVEAYKVNLADHDSVHVIVTIARHIVPREIEPALSAIDASRVPVLLIWGCQDHYVPLSFGSRLNARLKHSRLWAIDKCGHVPHGERPETVAPAVAAFLARGEMPV